MDSESFDVLIEGDTLIFVHHRPGTDDLEVAGEVVYTRAWEYWTGVCVPLQCGHAACATRCDACQLRGTGLSSILYSPHVIDIQMLVALLHAFFLL